MSPTDVTENQRRPAPAALSPEDPAPPPPASMLVRTGVGLSMIVVLGLVLALDSVWPQGFVYAALGASLVAVAMAEYARMAERVGVRANRRFLVVSGVALFLLQWAGRISPYFPEPWMTETTVLMLLMLGLLSVRVVRAQIDGALQGAAVSVLGLVYIPLLLSFVTAVRIRWGVAGLITALVVCKSCSTGAYFAGKLFGRRKLAPLVSPNKTVAGAVGAVVASVAVAWALSRSGWALMPPWVAVVYGLVVAAAATIGDLAASVLKRQARVKDSGNLLPGAGGMIDILDDVLFTAPVSFFTFSLCQRFWVGG